MSWEISDQGSLAGADGTFVGVAPDGHTVIVGRRGRATVWDDDVVRRTVELAGYAGGPVAFDTSGRCARLGHWTVDLGTGEAEAGAADVELLIAGLEFAQRAPSRFYNVGVAAVTADGSRLATTFSFAPSKGIGDDLANPGPDGELVLVDPAAGEFVAVLEETDERSRDRVIAIDDVHVVAAGARLGVWRTADGERVGGQDPRQRLIRTDVCLSPDGRYFAAGRVDGTVELGPPAAFADAVIWPAHDGRATAVAFHPNESLLATGGEDQQVKVWSITDAGAELVGWYFAEHSVGGLAFDPTGDHVFVATGRDVLVARLVRTG